jgi:type II restriction enzyme
MNLLLPKKSLAEYKSASQRARICTEAWGLANLYCPSCNSSRVDSLPVNTPAHDFTCPSCSTLFQLKSKSSSIGNRIQDGAFESMKKAIVGGRTPDLFLLHYQLPQFAVQNVLLIPHFGFSLSLLEKRKPLSSTARRAGWVGCNFLLDRIPPDAKIPVVDSGRAISPAIVRKAYQKVRPLEKLNIEKRGWTLDVLNVVRSLKKNEFVLSEVYDHADQLAEFHPQNHHINDKIRQQLQILRDMNLLEFLGNGSYRLP